MNTLQWNFNQNTKLFIHEKCIWKYRLRNGSHFVQGEMSNSKAMSLSFDTLWDLVKTASYWINDEVLEPISSTRINTLRPRQNGRHFADDIFKRIFFNENIWIPIKISLKFVPKGSIDNIPALVQIMAWRRPGDKPLSEPMMVNLPTHICVTRPQWVN